MAPTNAVINGQLTFIGATAGQVSIQAQTIGQAYIVNLPNTIPAANQIVNVLSVNGNVVTLGWAAASSSSVGLSQLTQSGASTGDVIQWNGTAWAPSLSAPGSGTVTTFSAGALSPLFTTSVATATSTPALTFTAVSQSANLVYASPNGSPGIPGFRALVAADIPSLSALYDALGAAAAAQTAAESFATAADVTVLSSAETFATSQGYITSAGTATTISGSITESQVTNLTTDLAAKAPLASPTFTGTVTLPAVSVTGALSYTTANPTFFSAQGNGSKVQLSTGTTTTGDVVTYDAFGNTVDSGTLLSSLATQSFVTTSYAPLASPTFTGTVTTAAISATSVSASTFVAVTGNLDLSSGVGHIVQNTDIAGSITITNPATSGSFSFVGTYGAPPVAFVTPTSDPSTAGIVSYWVTTTTGAITIHVNTTPGTSITFNYLTLGN